MTRSTASRRARNSASVTTARRRPASRPSRRRCFFASRRVEPLMRCGSVISSTARWRGCVRLGRRRTPRPGLRRPRRLRLRRRALRRRAARSRRSAPGAAAAARSRARRRRAASTPPRRTSRAAARGDRRRPGPASVGSAASRAPDRLGASALSCGSASASGFGGSATRLGLSDRLGARRLERPARRPRLGSGSTARRRRVAARSRLGSRRRPRPSHRQAPALAGRPILSEG